MVNELISNQRVVWHIEEAFLNFTEEPDEWASTDVTFEVTPKGDETEVQFTHRGFVSELECLGFLRQRESEASDHDRLRRSELGRRRSRVNRR